jgi:hypothetical protein
MKVNMDNPIKQTSLKTLEKEEAKDFILLNNILKRNLNKLKKLAENKFIYACHNGLIYYK